MGHLPPLPTPSSHPSPYIPSHIPPSSLLTPLPPPSLPPTSFCIHLPPYPLSLHLSLLPPHLSEVIKAIHDWCLGLSGGWKLWQHIQYLHHQILLVVGDGKVQNPKFKGRWNVNKHTYLRCYSEDVDYYTPHNQEYSKWVLIICGYLHI